MKYTKQGKTQYHVCRGCENERKKRYYKTKSGRASVIANSKRMMAKFPEKAKARNTVNWAVYVGKLSKPSFCDECTSKSRIEAHHEDYNLPLEVLWLCTDCHADLHKAKMLIKEEGKYKLIDEIG